MYYYLFLLIYIEEKLEYYNIYEGSYDNPYTVSAPPKIYSEVDANNKGNYQYKSRFKLLR